ncbi:MAG TPA: DMT family transporter [Armatimonadota bacterium]
MMVAMNLVWGASYLVADIGLREMTPAGLAAWRFLIATLVFFPILVVRRSRISIRRADIVRIVAIGGITVAGSYLLTYQGILLASSTDRAVVSPLEPVALAIMGAIFLRERLAGRQWAGIAVACIGAYLLVSRHGFGRASERVMLGQGLMLLSFFTEGLYSILGKPLLGRYRPLVLTVWAMLFATIILFLTAAFKGGLPAPPHTLTTWLAVLFLAIPCSVVGYTLWYLVLEHMPAGKVGVFVFLQPVVGIGLGMLFRAERATLLLLAGTLLVVLGVWLTGGGAVEALPVAEPSA